MERIGLDVQSDGVGVLRLCAADRRNAIDPLFVEELAARVDELGAVPGLRAVRLTAEGPAFTVGGDLRHFGGRLGDLHDALAEMVPEYHATLLRLAELPVPVVAGVRGASAGGGLGLAWCADVVIAGEGAVFATGFARLALSGDGASSWWLPRLVGLRRAQEILLRDRVLRGPELLEWGLVTELVADEEVEARAEAVAAELAAGPTAALARMGALLRAAGTRTLEEHLAVETAAILACGREPSAREGITSFLERRPPRFPA